MNKHEKYLARCIQLAQNGLGTTYPNPLVGSVIVYEDKIIGEGWHKKAGEPHAEVIAVNSVQDKLLLKNATIYVSLEPCSHHGKTPPCCDLIIHHKIPNVVIGTMDPDERVAGRGIKKLIEAGHHVTVGILADECIELNKRFFTFHKKKRPYVILKWAESEDGFIAPDAKNEQKPVWITNTYSRQLVHKWRSEEQAILVGTKTVVDDNPKLNTRDWKGTNPIRVIIDQNNRIPCTSQVFDNTIKTIVFCKSKPMENKENLIFETIDFEKDLVEKIIEVLYQHKIQSVIIEGGSKTIQSFIDSGIWDEAKVFKGKTIFKKGTNAPKINQTCTKSSSILLDKLLIFRNND